MIKLENNIVCGETINILREMPDNCIDLVLTDPFLGSGTTAVACKLTNRKYFGIELNPIYCKIAEKRVNKLPQRLDAYVSIDNV